MNAIILVGIKHSGKSTQGKLLAQSSRCNFVDLDDVIQEISNLSPRELYKTKGVEEFIKTEEEAAKKVLKDFQNKKVVIATGGGICDNQNAVKILKSFGKFVFLNVDEDIAFSRIIKKVSFENGIWQNLPAYIEKDSPKSIDDAQKSFHKFYERRTKIYSELADFTINLSKSDKTENCKKILQNLKF